VFVKRHRHERHWSDARGQAGRRTLGSARGWTTCSAPRSDIRRWPNATRLRPSTQPESCAR